MKRYNVLISGRTSWLTAKTAVRPNEQQPAARARKVLSRALWLRRTYSYILKCARRGEDTSTREVGTRACRTLRRAGLIVWSDNKCERVVVK